MRILLLSDLHFRSDWYVWASKQDASLTAIGGDLLDGVDPEGLLHQMISLKNWADSFQGLLAVSSGNHDGNIEGGTVAGEVFQMGSQPEALDLLQHENWMDALERPNIVTDRRSLPLKTPNGGIIVSTIPFYPGHQGPKVCDKLWEIGGQLRKETKYPWLVLHHEPPADTLPGGHGGDPALFYKIREYQPDFVLSGHIHGEPYRGDFADQIDRTWCFNPGVPVISRAIHSKIPNHVWLDLNAKTATWHATPNVGKTPIIRKISL